MRKLFAAIMAAGAAAFAGPVVAADLPFYPPVIEVPDVDYGVSGAFYLRGSAAGTMLWSKEANAYECLAPCGGLVVTQFPFVNMGYGYSVGAGFGYETGTGLRFDATVDYLANNGLKVTKGPAYGARAGDYTVNLRSTLALANVYYDFSLEGGQYGYGAAGGAFGYVGAGAGLAYNQVDVSAPAGVVVPSGSNTSFAAAGMVGVGYDFGSVVADVGYRGVYIAQLSNSAAVPNHVWADNNWVHEVRGTLRYRFN
ncbi:hypothetical protein DEVEQU_01481 [Devosia equisanguinis]|uniref:Outer membrane protein beta-barrel domain-containing protein n=1 Tax=Devosia equisanguinis TaxID=2490941 RepID=A0A447IA22_9HYPH|nr:hypothetical protein [Devosia equisanguinis]VDS04346.1 hypothetical protein DEVEQU_01481 [Devosia equisanguinis]